MGDVVARGRGVCRDGRTKPQSTRTRSGVRRPLEGTLPVGEELASDHRGASDEVHVEAREGRTCTTRCGTRLVVLGQGCEVEVKIPSDPERDPRSPGPGIPLRERWGWKPLLRTLTSGIWVLPGALQKRWVWGAVGGGCFMGEPQHLPHSLGGMSLVRLPMLVFVMARPSYRAAHWKRLLSLPYQCVEGSRTPFVALVCGRGCAICCELEPLRRLEVAC